jgi:hypothetical protein
MKNTLLAVLIAITIALGAVGVVQWQKLGAQKAELASLRAEAEQKAQEAAALQASRERVDQERDDLLQQQADDRAREFRAGQQAAGKAGAKDSAADAAASEEKKSGKNPFGEMIAKMMEDPETKKMIRDQQRLVMDQLYGPLIKKMQLTPEEASQFKDLLADNMMKGAENAGSLFNDTNRTEALEKLATDQKNLDEQIRGFLGESRYMQYKDYQQTAGERMQLTQFQQTSAASEHPLSDPQTEALLTLMKEEKQAVAASTGLPLPGDNSDPATMQAMFSGEGIDNMLQSQETVNQRVYERARDVLRPEQLNAFGQFQTNQLQMMRVGLTMARKFMAPEKSESASAPNP